MVIVALALFWGVLAAQPVWAWAHRVPVVERVGDLAGLREPVGPVRADRRIARQVGAGAVAAAARFGARIAVLPGVASVGRVVSAPVRTRRARAEDDALAVELATAIDLLAVAVSAGCTPYLAVELGAQWCPPRVAGGLDQVVRACAVGRSFDEAARDLGRSRPALRALTEVLRTSARLGTPAGAALGRLGAEQRADLRRRAEARARTVPVRLCLPLVGCVLPAFALLTVVPVVLDGLRS